MEVRFAVLADEAHVDSVGKLTITGIFRQIRAPVFPAVHPQCTLVIVLVAGHWDEGEHRLEVDFIDADGRRGMSADFQVAVADVVGEKEFSIVMPIRGLPLETAGDHSFEVLVDGRNLYSVPVEAGVPDQQSSS